MTFSRRGFLTAGAVTAGAGLATVTGAEQAMAATVAGGRSVLDFGVQANVAAAQTAALQKAINEIARSGHPVFFPAGHYYTDALKIPAECAIVGVPGASIVHANDTDIVFDASGSAAFTLSGLMINGEGKRGRALVAVTGGMVNVTQCRFVNAPAHALRLEKCEGVVQAVQVERAGTGIVGIELGAFSISQCRVSGCRADGIHASSGAAPGGVTLGQNHVAACQGAGIAVEGNAVVNGNFVTQARFGLRLGGAASGDGNIMASGNLLHECGVGIGASASGETIFATLNLIHAPKEGGIRALDGDKLLGPDLIRQSAEAYLNLTVAGNVVR